MDTYWACFRTNGDISCGSDPTLYAKVDDQTSVTRLDDFRTRDSRTLEIDLITKGESPHEAEEAMDAWLDTYLRQAEWLRELGVYDPDADGGADFHEPGDVFHRCGFEVRTHDME